MSRITESQIRSIVRSHLRQRLNEYKWPWDDDFSVKIAESATGRYLMRAMEVFKAGFVQRTRDESIRAVVGFANTEREVYKGSYNNMILRVYLGGNPKHPIVTGGNTTMGQQKGYFDTIQELTDELNDALAKAAVEMQVPPVTIKAAMKKQSRPSPRDVEMQSDSQVLWVWQFTLNPPTPMVVHVVKSGDSMVKIARMYRQDLDSARIGLESWHDDAAAVALAEFNGISNPGMIQPGQKIKIPTKN